MSHTYLKKYAIFYETPPSEEELEKIRPKGQCSCGKDLKLVPIMVPEKIIFKFQIVCSEETDYDKN